MGTEPEQAPDFTLEVANGAAVVLSELWVDRYLLLWFSRGLACPFCRRQIVQMTKIYARLVEAGVNVVQVTPTRMEVAKSMLEFYPVPWPYACDASGQVSASYRMGPEGIAARVATTLAEQRLAWGSVIRHPLEPHPEMLQLAKAEPARGDVDGGVVIVAPDGTIRFRQPTGKLSLLPSNDSLLRAVSRLAEQAA